MRDKDEAIRDGLAQYTRVAGKIGFKQHDQRSDNFLVYHNWSMETHFVHGEGRVILIQDRTRGDRERTRRIEIFVRDKVTFKDAMARLKQEIGSKVPAEIVTLP